MSGRTAYLIGWLEGFSTTVWALLSTNDGAKLVDASAGDEYERTVKELREALVDHSVCDTSPYVVKTVPLVNQPVDMTPKVTFKPVDVTPKATFKEETE